MLLKKWVSRDGKNATSECPSFSQKYLYPLWLSINSYYILILTLLHLYDCVPQSFTTRFHPTLLLNSLSLSLNLYLWRFHSKLHSEMTYGTSQKFGDTYSFKGYFLFVLFSTL
jgi:hypothetical protein